MLRESLDILDRFGELTAVVIGDVMLDSYLSGASRRLCPEAPVPVVDVATRTDMPGGAANCALNLARLGARVELLGLTGQDCENEQLRSLLAEAGIVTDGLLAASGRRTLVKTRVECDHHLLVRFDQGTTIRAETEIEEQLRRQLCQAVRQADLIIVSDYGYGTLSPPIIAQLAKLQRRHPRILAVDSKHLPSFRAVGTTICKPNFGQAVQLLGRTAAAPSPRRGEELAAAGESLLDVTGSRIVAVTLDRDGSLILERGKPEYRTFARGAPQHHTAGAGDTYLSTFALALAADAETHAAAELAAAAARVVVAKEHTSTCSVSELRDELAGEPTRRGDAAALLPVLDGYRRHRRKIVLTNGCFDILHRGHVAYLEQARRLGDVLVVGVNTDETIRRLKGPGRPINSLSDRMQVLSALGCVDHTVYFTEDTPHQLIELVRPDVFVKGGDYSRATLPEADLVERLGGCIKILPFVADRSTSGIIARICNAYGPTAAGASFQGVEHAASVAICPAPAVRPA
ncbi:MAG: D-glycero-beta-D-manno-heptose 1-phosphate adenylyltransferase [Pirellulaceae bacterium]